MSKTQSRAALVIASIKVFALHLVSTLFATADGEFFVMENRANLHNKTIKGGKVYEIDRYEADEAKKAQSSLNAKTEKKEPTSEILKGSNPDVAKAVLEINDVAVLDALLVEEKDTQNRKGAIASITERIEALAQSDLVPSEDVKEASSKATGSKDTQTVSESKDDVNADNTADAKLDEE